MPEVVAHLLTHELEHQRTPEQAMDKAMGMKGAFALAVIFAGRPDIWWAPGAARVSPWASVRARCIWARRFGLGALHPAHRLSGGGDWTLLRAGGAAFFNRGPVERTAGNALQAMVGKGNHRHFMMKEICERPAVIGGTCSHRSIR
jgi:glucosamine--fructose-6-phosphate aminotransferase (isomerizing)